MRYIYSFLFYLAIPFIFIRILWRSRRLADYRYRLAERFGYYSVKFDRCLWVHAVSVGEAIAAIPLIKALKQSHPDLPILVTTMTPTGAIRVKAALGDSVTHVYLPYDLPGAMRRFLNAMNPVIGVMMETELWPNLLHIAKQKNIPICLVNARLSEKSAEGYARVSRLTRTMLQSLSMIAANGEQDAQRFIELGAPIDRVVITGNIKFDLELSPDLMPQSVLLRDTLGKERFIWVAASTHEGEEEQVIAAHQKLREKNPNALLILVPRHPDRFDGIATLCAQTFTIARRSQQQTCNQETGIYLADTMGEMMLMYAACDVAFVAGSLVPRGGHNMLEPAALGKPILTGQYLFNFAEISDLFISSHALTKVSDARALADQLVMLMQTPSERTHMGERALQVVAANRGALMRQLGVINGVIPV